MKTEVDLVVIGAGSGGVRAARMAALNRVAIIEERFFGGTVSMWPSKKLFFYSAFLGIFTGQRLWLSG